MKPVTARDPTQEQQEQAALDLEQHRWDPSEAAPLHPAHEPQARISLIAGGYSLRPAASVPPAGTACESFEAESIQEVTYFTSIDDLAGSDALTNADGGTRRLPAGTVDGDGGKPRVPAF